MMAPEKNMYKKETRLRAKLKHMKKKIKQIDILVRVNSYQNANKYHVVDDILEGQPTLARPFQLI
jgi:hypothetical protein